MLLVIRRILHQLKFRKEFDRDQVTPHIIMQVPGDSISHLLKPSSLPVPVNEKSEDHPCNNGQHAQLEPYRAPERWVNMKGNRDGIVALQTFTGYTYCTKCIRAWRQVIIDYFAITTCGPFIFISI